MTLRIAAQELFDLQQKKLNLSWVAGQAGASRTL